MKTFKKLDLFGQEYRFETEEGSKNNTVQGAFFSLIVIITVVVVSVLFGQEIYKRTHPNVLQAKEFITNSEVSLKRYPIVFGFLNNGQQVVGPEIHDYLDFHVGNMIIADDINYNYQSNYTITDCKTQKDYFEGEFGLMAKGLLESANYYTMCIALSPESDLSVRNNYASQDSNFITITATSCKYNPDPNRQPSCKLQNDRDLDNLIFLVIKFDSYVDPVNYDVSSYSWVVLKLLG